MSAEKVSLSLPSDLLAEARERAGGNLSAYVADGLRRRVLADRLSDYLSELDDEYGPLTDEELTEARRIWHEV